MQHPFVNIAIKAARRAGSLILRSLERLDKIQIAEKAPNDFVTSVDNAAEKTIIDVIRQAYPSHGILAEESGRHDSAGDETVWIIDPLDGTMNFVHGYPQFTVSIGIQHKGRYEHGIVYDPFTQDLYTASRGHGAQLNGNRIRVSQRNTLNGALLGIGFPHNKRSPDFIDTYLSMFKDLYTHSAGIRSSGSAALNLALIAAGRLDGCCQVSLMDWDMAAGIVLISEAGGYISNYQGETTSEALLSGDIVAGTPKVHQAMLAVLNCYPALLPVR